MLSSSPSSAVLLVVKNPLVHDCLAQIEVHETVKAEQPGQPCLDAHQPRQPPSL